MDRTFRRLVTGNSEAGRSYIVSDENAPPAFQPGRAGVAVTELWRAGSKMIEDDPRDELSAQPFRLMPAPGGSAFRIVEYQPDSIRALGDHTAQFSAMGAGEARDGGARHFGFHRTETLDYAIVLSGEIFAIMDEGEALMRAGDVLIQRGTNHAWSNRTDRPAVIAFVLLNPAAE